jgi:hypothetical protein
LASILKQVLNRPPDPNASPHPKPKQNHLMAKPPVPVLEESRLTSSQDRPLSRICPYRRNMPATSHSVRRATSS